MQIVLGTHNQKKLYELNLLLSPWGYDLKTLTDFPDAIEVEETGSTFAENAGLKAAVQAKNLKQWVIGEDSGLSVDALDGRPGVYSSRYAGENASDQDNNEKLLNELANIPIDKRTAFYTSHISLSDPNGNVVIDCEDYCRGLIGFQPAGDAGFGYDPIFVIAEYHQSFAELGDAVKSVLSHRARALRKFEKLMQKLKVPAA
jgi:XTP/dITP diphosphohydrolase